jgi:flagellar motor switch protein FliN
MPAPNSSAAPDPAAILTMAGNDLAAELGRSLEAAVSKPVKVSETELSSVSADQLPALISTPSAVICLELGGVCQGRAAVLISSRVTAALVGLLKNLEGDELSARIESDLVDEDLEELGVAVGGSLAGLAEKIGSAAGETPGLGLGDTFRVSAEDPGELLALLGNGPYPVAKFDMSVDELASDPALLIFPNSFESIPHVATDDTNPTAPAANAPVAPAQAGPTSEVVSGLHPHIARILRLKLPVSVVVAEKEMALESVITLAPGAIIEFNKSADDDLDLYVNDHKIGEGEVVIVGERFGIQLHVIEGLRQRIAKLGAARPQ